MVLQSYLPLFLLFPLFPFSPPKCFVSVSLLNWLTWQEGKWRDFFWKMKGCMNLKEMLSGFKGVERENMNFGLTSESNYKTVKIYFGFFLTDYASGNIFQSINSHFDNTCVLVLSQVSLEQVTLFEKWKKKFCENLSFYKTFQTFKNWNGQRK